ncbi:MAG TPA: trehalose-phosphatase, partial [Candidatus Omnitrophota bacterium]|nr:trehalose-phosphatase [Candidatus Omnitrophota bacterium]
MRCFNDKLAEKIARAPRVFFFFDYDGTLTPIVQRPEKAVLKKDVRESLRALSRFKGVKIAIVSGRSLKDLQGVAGPIPGAIYAGNHGLEIKSKDFNWIYPAAKQAAKVMARIRADLKKKIRPVAGMLLENKTLGISLHYRLVPESKVASLYAQFQKAIAPWLRLGMIRVQEGKKVWEVRFRPRLWHKGKIVQQLLKKHCQGGRFLPVFFGDDRTDEDAFGALSSSGITVKVTQNPRAVSKARYYIHSPA